MESLSQPATCLSFFLSFPAGARGGDHGGRLAPPQHGGGCKDARWRCQQGPPAEAGCAPHRAAEVTAGAPLLTAPFFFFFPEILEMGIRFRNRKAWVLSGRNVTRVLFVVSEYLTRFGEPQEWLREVLTNGCVLWGGQSVSPLPSPPRNLPGSFPAAGAAAVGVCAACAPAAVGSHPVCKGGNA